MKRTLTIATMFLVTAAAFAVPRPHTQRGRDAVNPRIAAEFLDLTDAQKSQAQSLRLSMRATIEPLRAQLRNNREAVKAAVDAGNAQQAGQLLISGKAVREQIKAAHENFESQFVALLNAEQKSKWATLQELRKARRDARGHGDD